MIRLNKITFYYLLLAFAYIFANCCVLVFRRDLFYVFNLVPLIILIIYWAIFSIEKVVYIMVFFTPLAITLKELKLSESLDLSLPTEPIMAGIMLIYILNELMFKITPRNILKHPITILILIQLTWMLITSTTSIDFIVSIKYFTARMWFIFSCFFIMTQLFKDKKHLYRFIFAYAIPLAVVCLITMYQHSQFNFDDKTADWVVSPFYNDHTAYGAILAMYIPVIISLLLQKQFSLISKTYIFGLLAIFVAAIILSYARAGWLSLAAAFGIFLTLLLKIKFKNLLFTVATCLILFFTLQDQIMIALGRNNTDSEGGIEKNISSMTNITTDASNLERINRWSCAWRMFKDEPYLGWGPGTYMFNYAPYQKSNEKTIISTNFGDNGNAHSEYLGPLSEQGLPGFAIVVALLFSSLFLGYRLCYTVKDRDLKILIHGVLLGLFTYFVHGFLNNFLDTDKASVPFWGFLAILVCIDVYHKRANNDTNEVTVSRDSIDEKK